MVGEAIANVAQSTLLDILFDGVESLFFTYLHFSVGPAGNFNDHVEDAVILVREEGDVVPWADGGLGGSRFEVRAVLWEILNRAGRDGRSQACYALPSIEGGAQAVVKVVDDEFRKKG